MIYNYFRKTIHKKVQKSCSKFMFLTKMFKEKISVMFLKLFLNAMIKKIKICNIFDIIEISKYMKPKKCIQKNL
jgi:hypothetical protein